MTGLVRRRVSVVVVHNEKLLGFYAEDPTSLRRYFFVPGGLIEAHESIQQAAVRETLEETGYRIEVMDHPAIERRYEFEWDGAINDCQTTFLLGQLLSDQPEKVDDASYHRGVGWIPLHLLNDVFAYHVDILQPVLALTRIASKNKMV